MRSRLFALIALALVTGALAVVGAWLPHASAEQVFIVSAKPDAQSVRPFAPVALLNAKDFAIDGATGDIASQVRMDQNGDTVVVGSLDGNRHSFVAKFQARNTIPLWKVALSDVQECSLALDKLGGIAVAGGKAGRLELTRISSGGEIIWHKTLDGEYATALAVAVDSKGHVVVSGTLLQPGYGYEFAVFRFSEDGQLLWARTIPGWQGAAVDVAIDSADAIVGVGMSGAPVIEGLSLFTVAKWSSDGEPLWVHAPGPGIARDVALDTFDNVIVVGELENQFSVTKYDQSGALSWKRVVVGTLGDGAAYAVAIDGSDGVIAVGSLQNSSTNSDFTAVKFNSAGMLEWRNEINGDTRPSTTTTDSLEDYALAVAVDGDGSVYASGLLWGYKQATAYGGLYIAGVKWRSDGAHVWTRQFVGSESAWVIGKDSVAVDDKGNAAVVGGIAKSSGGLDAAIAFGPPN